MIEKPAHVRTSLLDDPLWQAELASTAMYPETDGQPRGDNTTQIDWIFRLKANLDLLFWDRGDVFVAANLFWYPVEGESELRQSPKSMVVFGRPKHDRMSYRQWHEANIPPHVVIDVLPSHSEPVELREAFEFYEHFGVEEFYRFEPISRSLDGWNRRGGHLVPIPNLDDWVSPRLGIRFRRNAAQFQALMPDGSLMMSPSEMIRQARQLEKLREIEQQVERMENRLRELGVDPNQVS
jgi:Uma2 family endonuclease